MRARAVVMVVALSTLTGCASVSESRFNPFNWFGGREDRMAEPVDVRPDPRPLVAQITRIAVDPAPGGIILTATGIASRQGAFAVALTPTPSGEAGVLAYQFRAAPPQASAPAGSPASREVTVATFISDQSLDGVREIRVISRANVARTRP